MANTKVIGDLIADATITATNLANQLADKIAPKVVTLQLHKSYPDHFIGVDETVAEQGAEEEAGVVEEELEA